MRAAFALGRILFGGFFFYNGLNHFRRRDELSQRVAAKGVRRPDAVVTLAGAMLVAGGASVMAGARPRQGLAMLVAFLIPVTLRMHRFWEIADEKERTSEMTHFMTNLALAGAALTMMQIREPWPMSVDAARFEEEMYVRLGGRDLRALPA
jgi:uncharacterized membrane protein YphA (DoxX/SURF4 family)